MNRGGKGIRMANLDRFVSQVTSGRWILTVLAGLAFFAFCLMLVVMGIMLRSQFKAETIVSMFASLLIIIQGVYKDYFYRSRDKAHPDENHPVVESESDPKPDTEEVS